jgi:hypothetical protein
LEQSRSKLEQNGVHIAAISYDGQRTLRDFGDKYAIHFPLLSDKESTAIRAFGLFNVNIAPGLRAHGVPHPVTYLVAADGTVKRKYLVPNYMHRVTGSEIVMREFGSASSSGPSVTIRSGPLTANIGLSGVQAFAGQEIGFFAKFQLEPGWHVYGSPLPDAYTALTVAFDDPKVIRQNLDLPPPQAMEFKALGETLPAYSGTFEGLGSLLLKFPMDAGPIKLAGQLRFQACSETVCEAPTSLGFELPLTIEPFLVAIPRK